MAIATFAYNAPQKYIIVVYSTAQARRGLLLLSSVVSLSAGYDCALCKMTEPIDLLF